MLWRVLFLELRRKCYTIYIYIYISYIYFFVFVLPGTSMFLCYSVLKQIFSFEVVIIRPGTTGYHGRILCSVFRQQVF